MELHAFLRSRRSRRRYSDENIPRDVIERMLETAIHAPSAHNRQPWRFCVLQDATAKGRLAEETAAEFRRDLARDGLPEDEIARRIERSRARINGSPLVIVLCMDISEMDKYADAARSEAERSMATQSVAGAGLQLLLAAQAEGLASVWTCSPLFAPRAVQRALELSETWEPQAMFFIGHSEHEPGAKELKPLTEVVRWY